MKTQTLAIALLLAAGSAFASVAQAEAPITTLETVQVLPAADQVTQQQLELSSNIPTLAAVQVRPSVGQIVELIAEQAATKLAANTPAAIGVNVSQWVVSLPAVIVRPDAQLVQTLAAEAAADTIGQVARGLVSN